jgi:hypothetical protein
MLSLSFQAFLKRYHNSSCPKLRSALTRNAIAIKPDSEIKVEEVVWIPIEPETSTSD